MEKQNFDENIVLKLKRHLSKMMVQVDFLYRNGREMSQFDYDMLMDRTREFYELLVDAQVVNDDDDDNDDDNDNHNQNDVEFEIEVPGNENYDDDDDDNDNDDEELDDDEDWEDEEDVTFSVEHINDTKDESVDNQEVENTNSVETEYDNFDNRLNIIDELFKGSEERYEQIINELYEFPTIGGALVYLSELSVQLQWNTQSEAYANLKHLVERHFL